MIKFATRSDIRAHVGPLMGSMVTEEQVHAVADVLWAEGIRSASDIDEEFASEKAWNEFIDEVLA